jgi:hypothetical protein
MNNLGHRIRALRLGFYWTGTCYLRISPDLNPKLLRCDLRPAGLVPNCARQKRAHYVWWEGGYGLEVINRLALARCRVKRAFSVTIDDNGYIV